MSGIQDDVLWRQAKIAYEAKRYSEAKLLCEELIRQNRKNVNALNALGQNALAEGNYEDAATFMLKYATLRPKDPHAQAVLGEIRTLQGRHREAITRFDRALRLQPDYSVAIAGKADAYEKCGQRDKALALLKPYVTSDRDTPEMDIVQARLDLRAHNDTAVINLIQEQLKRNTARGYVLSTLCSMLGTAYERTGKFDEAFTAYVRGNEAVPVNFNANAWLRHTDELIESFSFDRFTKLPRATNGSSIPVFIIGMPRSGSTLVETIIDAHPKAHGGGEFRAMQEVVNSITFEIGSTLPYPACIADLTLDDVNTISYTYLERVALSNPNALRIVDKYLANYRHLGLISVLFPNARIIHCHRHPLDTCFSCYSRSLIATAHPYASDLRHLGMVYASYEKLMTHWREVLHIPMLEIQYESLVENQEHLSREIIDFCGLEWDDNCLRYYESGRVTLTASYDQVSQPIYSSSIGRYRNFEKHLGPLRDELE